MNFVVAPPNHRDDGAPEGDEVDQTLRAFFKAQVPDPWPSFEAPPESSVLPFVTPRRRSSPLRGRLALAASVAFLAAAGWFLSGKFVDPGQHSPSELPHTDGTAEKLSPGALPRGTKLSQPFTPVTPDGAQEFRVIGTVPDR